MFRYISSRLFFFLIIQISTFSTFGQDPTFQNWWFGNGSTGIQFTQPFDSAKLMTRPTGPVAVYGNGGGAVASDLITGGLLFYTDGNTVFDNTHNVMVNGTGLLGNTSSNQPAVICRVPDDLNRYFIITNDATPSTPGQLRLAVVDMTLAGNNVTNPNFPAPPLGEVVSRGVDIANLNNEAEAMVIVKRRGSPNYWLITQEFGTTGFNISEITAAGISGPANFVTPGPSPSANPAPPPLTVPFRAAHFSYDSIVGRLAVAPADANRNVMLFDFDEGSGAITFNRFLPNSAVAGTPALPAIFDVQWPNRPSNFDPANPNNRLGRRNRYFYVSRQGDATTPGNILQYDLSNPTASPLVVPTPATMVRSYGLQMGSDSSLYHIYQETLGGPFRVGRIPIPDTIATDIVYDQLPFDPTDLATNANQFPSFLVSKVPQLTLSFEASGTCANTPITFFPTVEPGADSLTWDFGDNSGASAWSPVHTYTAAGTVPVTMTAWVNGQPQSVEQDLTILDFNLQITLVQDTVACACQLGPTPTCDPLVIEAQASAATGQIQWYGPDGLIAGGNTLTLPQPILEAGFYYVVVQDQAGTCETSAGVNIREYGVPDPRANIWHFGTTAGIDFNEDFGVPGAPDGIQGPVTSIEGVSTISDPNGQAIISTNGEQVFDRTGAPLVLDPPGLGGSQDATQSSLIVPVPDDPTLYYIFVTREVYPQNPQGGYEVRYAVFDLKKPLNGQVVDPDGDPSNGVTTVLFTKSTERLTGTNGWVIAHEYGNNNFRAYQVTANGVSTPIISSIGSDHSLAVAENGQGYMKLSGSGILAVALSNPGTSNVVEYFDFVDSTGAVINYRSVDLQQPNGQAYGIEFSSGGEKMFVSTRGPQSELHEFAFNQQTQEYERRPTIPPVPSTTGQLGAIQVGPDGTIYVAIDGSTTLGTIQANTNFDQPSTFNPSGFNLAGGTSSTFGLPNFVQNITQPEQQPTIAATGSCEDTPVTFAGTGRDIIDEFTWRFGDPLNSSEGPDFNLNEVEFTYTDAGTYNVILELRNRCEDPNTEPLILTTTVTINPAPIVESGVVALCNGAASERMVSVLPENEQPGFTYNWSFGDATRDPFAPDQGIGYTVTVTTALGCTATGTWDAFDIRPQIELGSDQTLCESNGVTTLVASQTTIYTYAWTLNGTALPDTDNSVDVPLSQTSPPAYVYEVTATDPGSPDPSNPCTVTDNVTITINPTPDIDAIGNPPDDCALANGSIDLSITSPGTFTYQVTASDGSTFPGADVTGPTGTPINISPLDAGAYNVFVSDQVSGCTTSETVGINDIQFSVSIAQGEDCADAAGFIPVIITTDAAGQYHYRILEFANTTPVSEADGTGTPLTVSPGVQPGDYVAEIRRADGCIQVSDPAVTIAPDPGVPIDRLSVNDCVYPPVFTVESSTNLANIAFLWEEASDNGITTANEASNPSITLIDPAEGLFSYSVTLTPAVGSGFCPVTQDFLALIDQNPAASIEQSDACSDQVTLTAGPTGDYTYRWFLDDTAPPTQLPGNEQLIVTSSGNYRVEAINNVSGCSVESPQTPVSVIGTLTVELGNDPPCEGRDYTITADINQPNPLIAWFYNPTAQNPGLIQGETSNALIVTDDREGTFRIQVNTGPNGECEATDEVSIVVSPTTPGLLPDEGIICPDPSNTDANTKTVTLNPGEGFLSYNWFKDGQELGETTPTLVATETGTYSVDLVNIYNCPSSDNITLSEECDPQITGPNAFRPAGLNNEFSLFTFFIDPNAFEIYIFNRWGEMVFYDDNPSFKWNGGYNNDLAKPLPPGTYSYLVKFRSSYRPELGVEEYRGGVVLLR